MNERKADTLKGEIRGLIAMLARNGVNMRADAGESLASLGLLIQEWNERVNLVSRKDISRLVSYHFCDAASLLPIVGPDVKIRVLDVGGSNGLPGLVLSALSPNVQVTVCDSRQKRRPFLEEACAAVGDNASHVIARVDSESFRTANQGKFDLIVARAVTRLRLLLKWCLPLLRPGGFLAAYKGSRCAEEVRQAEGYLWSHGVSLVLVLDSPLAGNCNPLRRFAIIGKNT
jgi:16S rRNA (guanine527-N7)-methyltransferase